MRLLLHEQAHTFEKTCQDLRENNAPPRPCHGGGRRHLTAFHGLSGRADPIIPRIETAVTTDTSRQLEGMWLTLSKPKYSDCLGQNAVGDYMYTMGRMSFDIFRPTSLVSSIQGMFMRSITYRGRCARGDSDLQTYNIVTAFTIEPRKSEEEHGPSRPLRGLLITFGYNLPDPNVLNRFTIEVNDPLNEERKRVFGGKDVISQKKQDYWLPRYSWVLLCLQTSKRTAL